MACVVAGLGVTVYELARDAHYRHERKQQIESRFGKKPVAKCYCIDCRHRSDDYCIKKNEKVRLDWFCSQAEPREGTRNAEKEI